MSNSFTSQSSHSSKGDEFAFLYKKREFKFQLHTDVAKPNYNSFFLAENIKVGVAQNILDLGTGIGFFAVLLAGTYQVNVTAVDLNPFAVKLTRANAQLNGIGERVDAKYSNLFTSLENHKFDLIICNPPFTPIRPKMLDDQKQDDLCFYNNSYGGIDGRDVIDRIITQAGLYLNARGRLILIQPDYVNSNKTIQMLRQLKFEPQIIAQKRFPLGTLGTLQKSYIESELGHHFVTGPDGLTYQTAIIIESVL